MLTTLPTLCIMGKLERERINIGLCLWRNYDTSITVFTGTGLKLKLELSCSETGTQVRNSNSNSN